jgi:multisubunit Na+/H+ antiporter MnhG subunit
MNQQEKPDDQNQLWKKITLKQIFVALIRLQALWLFFNAAVYLTYLPSYLQKLHYSTPYSPAYADAKFALLMELLRILMHVVAAMLIIQYTEPVLNYLLKDAADEEKSLEPHSSEQSGDSSSESKPL